MRRLVALLTLIMLAAPPLAAQVRELVSPAAPGSVAPNLAAGADGRVYLSWIDKLGEGRSALRFAVREGDGWSAPQTIAEGSDWFVNWADFPSLVVLPDGSLAAHWLVKSGPGTYAYDVHISRSFDGGRSWTKPLIPHRDKTETEHGFVSLFAAKDGSLAAIWLDGREMKGEGHGGHGQMTLRYAKIGSQGELSDEEALDTRVCECCQTSAALSAEGPVIVYRDRSNEEVRDISILRWKQGRWLGPREVARDGWQINGCPVNGPAVAAVGSRVAVAWYTGAGGQGQVRLAFSDDGGASFGAPIRVDDGQPLGRVDVILSEDGSALVSWLEKRESGGEVRLRRISREGKSAASITVAPAGTARSSGFPRMIEARGRLIFAWTGKSVLTAELKL